MNIRISMSALVLSGIFVFCGFTTGCSDDSGPKDMPKETTPEPGDTTFLFEDSVPQYS